MRTVHVVLRRLSTQCKSRLFRKSNQSRNSCNKIRGRIRIRQRKKLVDGSFFSLLKLNNKIVSSTSSMMLTMPSTRLISKVLSNLALSTMLNRMFLYKTIATFSIKEMNPANQVLNQSNRKLRNKKMKETTKVRHLY